MNLTPFSASESDSRFRPTAGSAIMRRSRKSISPPGVRGCRQCCILLIIVALFATRQVGQRLDTAIFDPAATRAANTCDVTMQFQHVPAAGCAMQSINILRDQRKLSGEALFKSGQGMMTGIRLNGPEDPVRVPLRPG